MNKDEDKDNLLHAGGVLYKIASFQYNEKLEALMDKDVFVCGPDDSVKDIAQTMARRKISSAIVADNNLSLIGIVTERDLVNKIVACDGGGASKKKVSEIMTPNPVFLTPQDSLFDSLYSFTRYSFKHLPIVENGTVKGIVTMRQIMKIRYSEPFVIIGELDLAQSPSDYKKLKEDMINMVQEKLSLRADPVDVVAMLSLVNHEIQKRLLECVIEDSGKPPVEFCFFVTGSHGRMENLLFPDQDFCVILDEYKDEDHKKIDEYFCNVSQKFSDAMNEAGYPYCTGNIMGQNPDWRKRITDWKTHISKIFNEPGPFTVRHVTLLFDSAFLYGSRSLFNIYSEYSYQVLSKNFNVIRQMHDEEEGRHKVPLGFFNTFITEKDREHKKIIDMKRSGLLFFIESSRILALRKGIRETSTINRLLALVAHGVIHKDDSEYFENAYRVMLHHTLMAQADNYIHNGTTDYYLDPYSLSDRSQEILKQAFKALSKLQEIVGSEFGELIL